ncbi:MAG: chorismate synthase, partial [Elusimicrobiota bacterium]|nr:chorismate synthase [Elusimicrobiota bacterium]
NIQERASARETAMRVAIGAICKKFLSEFDIKIFSVVEEICGVVVKVDEKEIEKNYNKIENSPVRCSDSDAEKKMIEVIDRAKASGDSVGGVFKIVLKGVPPGLGSHTQWDKKLDARLAQSIISIQAVKGVEFGLGFEFANRFGSEAHDEIFYDKNTLRFYRKTNNSGGIEGGMTNGEDVVIRVVMKPIPSLKQPLKSVDIKTKEEVSADIVRSDVCAVPSCAVIAESAVAFTVTDAFLDKFSGDSIIETKSNFNNYLNQLKQF